MESDQRFIRERFPRSSKYHPLILIFALLLAPLSAAEPTAKADGHADFTNATPAGYQAYFINQLDALRSRYFRTADAFLTDNGDKIHVASMIAASELRAWRWTQDERYARSAIARLRLIASKADSIREVDFFTVFPLSFAWRIAMEDKLVDDALIADMAKFASLRFKPRDFNELNNQTMQRACGLALAAQLWPTLPQAKSWNDYALTIHAMLDRIEDIPENAPNYNTLDLVCVWLLADVLSKPEITAKPGIAAMYRRYRDQVSPAGFMAPYGDSGSASHPLNPDWPMNSPWAHYVAAFERAAHEYRDPTLRWAATRLAQAGARNMPLAESYTDVESLFYFSFAVDWTDSSRAPTPPPLGSQVLTRRDRFNAATPDKLILASSRAPGTPFVMTDLYCRGAHGHVNQHGAVTYFESRDTPLLTAMGYNSRDAAEANLVFMGRDGEPFPHRPDGFSPDVWHDASLPTDRLPLHDETQPFMRRIDGLNFRITAGHKGVVFSAAKVRLEGSNAPAITLDDLRDGKGWGGDPRIGDEGLTWDVPQGVKFLAKTGFGRVIDCREYSRLTFRWKLSNNDEQSRPLILRVQCGERSIDYHAQTTQLDPTLVSATFKESNGIQFGTLHYKGWFTPDTTLCRQMALTSFGALIVRDTLVPGELARGQVAGPIWHMASTSDPVAGPNWFNSTGGKVELFTWFAPASSRTFAKQTVNVWSKENQQTVFAKQPLQPGQTVTFISVLVPHDRGTDAATLAESISVDGNRVRIRFGRDDASVDFTDEGIQP